MMELSLLRGGGLTGAREMEVRWLRLRCALGDERTGKESSRGRKIPAAAVGDSCMRERICEVGEVGVTSESSEASWVRSIRFPPAMAAVDDVSTRFSGLPLSFSVSRFHHSTKDVLDASVKAGAAEALGLV